MTWIFLSPAPVRTTSNSVFSSAAAAARRRRHHGPAIIGMAARDAELSSSAFTRSATSRMVMVSILADDVLDLGAQGLGVFGHCSFPPPRCLRVAAPSAGLRFKGAEPPNDGGAAGVVAYAFCSATCLTTGQVAQRAATAR